MQILPSLASAAFTDAVIHIDESDLLAGPDAVIKSTQVDAGASPTTTIRKGNVIVLKTSDGLYYLDDGAANAASADRNTPASVSSATGITSSWANSSMTFVVNGGPSFVVTAVTATNTNTLMAAVLNADLSFRGAGLIADVSASALRIRSLKAGRDQYFKATSSYASAFGSSVAFAVGHGADADYLVTEEEISMLLPTTGVATNTPVRTSRKAYYDESALCSSNSTISDEARAVLLRNGARFG